jgi:DNA polymerase-4
MIQKPKAAYRKILHFDLDAFFCAVEEQQNPNLVGKPFAVGGRPDERGVVASCSYAARKFGVRSAMPMAHALRLCPTLKVVSSRHGNYGKVSKNVMAYLDDLTPLVEKVSIDEAFLNVTDLPESGLSIARGLQRTIRTQLNLPSSLGIATNKLVAKIANDVGKAAVRSSSPPNAITEVPPGEEANFLAPLPVTSLWGIGDKTAEKLDQMGLKTIGELADFPENRLIQLFGKYGHDLYRRSHGTDDRPITTSYGIKSVSHETTFASDVTEREELRGVLIRLSDRVARRLRKANLCGNTVRLKLRWADFTTITRQSTLQHATDQDGEIYRAVWELFVSAWHPSQSVRLIGVGVSSLGPPVRQLSFWEDDFRKEARLLSAVDELRNRYGDKIVIRASNMPVSKDRNDNRHKSS